MPHAQPPGTAGARSSTDPAPREEAGEAPEAAADAVAAAADVVEEVTSPSTYIEPSFDLKAMEPVLSNKEASTKEQEAILLGIHYKF